MNNDELTELLKTYVDPKCWKIQNWDNIILNQQEEGDYIRFSLSGFDLLLTKDTYEFYDVDNIHGFEGAVDESTFDGEANVK